MASLFASLDIQVPLRVGARRPLALALLSFFTLSMPADAELSAAQRLRAVDSGIVGLPVLDALEEAEEVRVVVVFSDLLRAAPRGRAAIERRRRRVATRRGELLRGISPGELRMRRAFDAVDGFSAEVSAAGLMRLLDRPRVRRVDLEARVEAQLGEAVPLVELAALGSLGWQGTGVRVAIVDTGVDLSHADVGTAVVDERCFCAGGCCPDGSSDQAGPGSAQDDHLHGTLVAGIVTSDGVVAPPGGAPDAEIVAVKVLSSGGAGTLADLVAGLNWVLVNQPEVKLLNMSLGFPGYAGDCDTADANTMALAMAVDALHANGVLTVSSSGNEGSGTLIHAPACLTNALAVGAVWDANVGARSVLGCTDATTAADQVTCYSNSNDRTDVFAPGGQMSTTLLGGGVTHNGHGTSLAAPVVTACAAALFEAFPAATPAALKAALEASPTLVTDATNGLSFPRIDCVDAFLELGGVVPVPVASIGGMAILVCFLVAAGVAAGARRTRRW